MVVRILLGSLALAALVSLQVHRASTQRAELVSSDASPFSSKWSQASSADSKFLDAPSVDERADADYKREVSIKHTPQTVFRHGETRVSLGPAAIRTIADGSGIKWTTPTDPEVQAAQEAAGSIETGFGGGNTM